MTNIGRSISDTNRELYDDIREDYRKNIDAGSLVKILPAYTKYIMTNNNEDLDLEIILNNVMNLKVQRKNDECDFLVPTFIPVSLNEKVFSDLIYSLYHIDKNEEQMNLLIDLFVNEFGSDDKKFLFDYFVNVGFPNLFQNFMSINYCEEAASIINSLILISQKNDQAINLTTQILSKFILSSFPFMQEFRNYFSQETLFAGTNGINQDIKDPFINSFKNSIAFLSKPHISVLKSFFNTLPGHQKNLIGLIFNGIFTNVQNMHQFLTNQLILTAGDVDDEFINIINDLDENACFNIPNIDYDLFYNQKKKISFTHADVFILSKINQKFGKGSIFSDPNDQISDISMNSAFTIFKDFLIEIETEPEKDGKPVAEIKKVNQSQITKWEGVKDDAASKYVDPFSLLDLSKEDATDCFKVVKAQKSANIELQTQIRERMGSIVYIKEVKNLITQMNSELLNHFAKIDLGKPFKPPKKGGLFKSAPTKGKLFSDNFLSCYLAQYSRDSTGKTVPLNKNIANEIDSANFYIEKYDDLQEFIEFFTNIQIQILVKMCNADEESRKRIQQNQKYIKDAKINNTIMFNWLHKLFNFESLLSINDIKIDEKADKKVDFDRKVNTEIIYPYYKVINLLKSINDELNKQVANKSMKSFRGDFISAFVLIINEACKDIFEWEADHKEEYLKNKSEKSKNDSNEEEEEEEEGMQDDYDFNVDVADIIFSAGLENATFYRILNTLMDKKQKQKQVSSEYHNALNKLIEKFIDRKR